jgi:hypothetical protein
MPSIACWASSRVAYRVLLHFLPFTPTGL